MTKPARKPTATMAGGIQTKVSGKGVKTYRAMVKVDGKAVWSETFKLKEEARGWRSKALGEIQAGTRTKTSTMTVREAWEEWKTGALNGTILNASGGRYKPGTIRTYAAAWKLVDPEFGAHKLSDIRRPDVQLFMEEMAAPSADAKVPSASAIRNAIEPLRAIYRRAIELERVSVNPMNGLKPPRPGKRRERICTPEEAQELLALLPSNMRPMWATAFYAGLRRGELRALRWDHVDLASGRINVERSWDDAEGDQTPKSKAGKRRLPIIAPLAALLVEQQERTARSGKDLVFGKTATEPFSLSGDYSRSRTAWKTVQVPPTLHDARHTFASYLIHAGCNAKALSVAMGHASISVTFDTYGHLMPGGEAEVGRLLAEYLASE